MLKLIKLEWKKNNIGKYIIKVIVLAALIALFIYALAYLGIANDPDTGVPDAAPGNELISTSIEMFTGMAFLILGGVMLSSFIISAYRNGTMDVMFLYPIKRQKILVSQMLAVWIFDFTALVLTKLFVYGCILAGSRFTTSFFPIDFDMTAPGFYIQMLIRSAVTVTEAFIALYVGLAMKSSKAAIVTSFVMVFLTQGNIGSLTLKSSAPFMVVLTILSVAFAFLSVYKVETRDLM